jgi:hypothetical protein
MISTIIKARLIREPAAGYKVYAMSLIVLIKPVHIIG